MKFTGKLSLVVWNIFNSIIKFIKNKIFYDFSTQFLTHFGAILGGFQHKMWVKADVAGLEPEKLLNFILQNIKTFLVFMGSIFGLIFRSFSPFPQTADFFENTVTGSTLFAGDINLNLQNWTCEKDTNNSCDYNQNISSRKLYHIVM